VHRNRRKLPSFSGSAAVAQEDDLPAGNKFWHNRMHHICGKLQFEKLLCPQAVAQGDGKGKHLVFLLHRHVEHDADEAVFVKVIGAVMGGMLEQPGAGLKFCTILFH